MDRRLVIDKTPTHQPLIVCVGSPFGSDSIGIRVGELLQQRRQRGQLPGWMQVECYDRPGMALLQVFARARRLVIVDALVSSHPAGSIVELQVDELWQSGDHFSSHQIGVAQVLAMAKALHQIPESLYLFGICVGETSNWNPGLMDLNHVADRLVEKIALCFYQQDSGASHVSSDNRIDIESKGLE